MTVIGKMEYSQFTSKNIYVKLIQFNFQNNCLRLLALETQTQRFDLCSQGAYNHEHKEPTIIDERLNIKWTMARPMVKKLSYKNKILTSNLQQPVQETNPPSR